MTTFIAYYQHLTSTGTFQPICVSDDFQIAKQSIFEHISPDIISLCEHGRIIHPFFDKINHNHIFSEKELYFNMEKDQYGKTVYQKISKHFPVTVRTNTEFELFDRNQSIKYTIKEAPFLKLKMKDILK